MTEMKGETARNSRGDHWVTDEAFLLDEILKELRGVRTVLERIEQQGQEVGREFLPWVRQMMGRRAVRAAASASGMFRGGSHH